MPRHLLLRLDAPLMSFGGDMVDAYGIVRDFPARSMITGLIANALGWERYDAAAHDRLQARLVMGSVRVREGWRVRDFQTVQLAKTDKGWTTWGRREGRGGNSYDGPHIRYRDADANALMLVALRFDPADEAPELDTVAAALDRPERPLFIGRKPFLPSGPIGAGTVEAPTIAAALARALEPVDDTTAHRAQWPVGEGEAEGMRESDLTDERNWQTGVHAGLRRVLEGRIAAPTT